MSLVALFNAGLAWLAYLLGLRTKKPSEIGRGQTVVIVGGGFAGATLAHYLETTTEFQIVLLDRKEYFEFTPSMLRNMVEPAHWKRTSVRYADMPILQSPRIRLVIEEVVTLTDQAVQAKSGEWYKYDKLVLAMGSDYYDNIKPDLSSLTYSSRQHQLSSMHTALRSASSVNIFGAGLVGVELAAEIAETFPSKKLTLRSREPHLLPGFPEKAQRYALNWFRSRNVTVILENSIPPSKYIAEAGETVYNCTGLKPVKLEGPFRKEEAAAASKGSNGTTHGIPLNFSSFVDPRTHTLRVSPAFHLVGQESIFALGDVMIEDEKKDAPPAMRAPKVAYQAELQAWVVSENLKRQAEKRREWSFPEDVIGGGVTTLPTIVDCSLGRKDGIVILNDLVITGRLPAIQKDVLEMLFLRGWLVGEFVWTIVDPISLYMHRFYLAVVGRAKAEQPRP